jgi:formylglycine-generating enzyme required for sulfatase activity
MRTLIAAAFIFLMLPAHGAPKTCAESLRADHTDGFIAYLSKLVDERLIGEQQLQGLVAGIKADNKIVNPIPHETAVGILTFSKAADQIHFHALNEYISETRLDSGKVLHWAEGLAAKKQEAQVQREEVKTETVELPKIKWHRLVPGKFTTRVDRSRVSLSRAIEVMAMPVTQDTWMDVMGQNPAHFKSDNMNPIENITWWSAAEFANRLSIEHGYRPVYNFSDVEFIPGTSAEAGTLAAKSGHDSIVFDEDNIYAGQGYRLPTAAEAEFLVTGGGKELGTGAFFPGVKEAKAKDYAWYKKNSGNATHPVGKLQPFIIDGKEFYDLIGNVEMMTSDYFLRPPSGKEQYYNDIIIGGYNPFQMMHYLGWDDRKENLMVTVGAAYNGDKSDLSRVRTGTDVDKPSRSVGFRLVRTVD